MIVRLDDLERMYRARENARHRVELRSFILDRADPSAPIYQLVSRRLCATGLIDNLGLTDCWIDSASETERATPFSEIVTDRLGR
jgi:hypothetical protein